MSAVVRELVTVAPVWTETLGLGRRQPPRRANLWQSGYEADFDDDTLWYDLFYRMEEECLVAVGPPRLNLAAELERAGAHFLCGQERLEALPLEMDRFAETWIRSPGARSGEPFRFAGGQFAITFSPGANHTEWFTGKRTLFTLSRDNSLVWIRDWVAHHVRRHGAEAVLFYDNGSSLYTPGELLSVIAAVPGIETAVVVPWPFRYGPQGGTQARLPWDSDFCQHGAFSHARWRFLEQARCVLNCDVDEILAAPAGASVFSLCEESDTGYLPFPGRWCYAHPPAEGEIRHRNHILAAPEWSGCPLKWAAVPGRIPPEAQWKVHSISGVPAADSKGLHYWHCRSANTSWKGERSPAHNPPGLGEHDVLVALWKDG